MNGARGGADTGASARVGRSNAVRCVNRDVSWRDCYLSNFDDGSCCDISVEIGIRAFPKNEISCRG